MSAPWPRHSLWGQCVKVCLGHHTGYIILILGWWWWGKSVLGNSPFCRERGPILFGVRHSLLGSSPSLSCGLFTGWGDSFLLGEGPSLATSRVGGGGYTARRCSHYAMWGITPIDSVSNGVVLIDSSPPTGWGGWGVVGRCRDSLTPKILLPHKKGASGTLEDPHWRLGPRSGYGVGVWGSPSGGRP